MDSVISMKEVWGNAVAPSARIVVEDENMAMLGGWEFLTPSGEGSRGKLPL